MEQAHSKRLYPAFPRSLRLYLHLRVEQGLTQLRSRWQKGWLNVPFDVTLHSGESQESLLRRFQKMVQLSGILRDFRSHQRFMSKRDAYLVKAKNNARRKRRQSR